MEQVLLVDRVERLLDIDFYHVQSLPKHRIIDNRMLVSLNASKKMIVKKRG